MSVNTLVNTIVAIGLIIQVVVIRVRVKSEYPNYVKLTLAYDWLGVGIWSTIIIGRLLSWFILKDSTIIFNLIYIGIALLVMYMLFIKELIAVYRS